MEKPQSLADFLGVADPLEGTARLPDRPSVEALLDVTEPVEFCRKILETREFRQYIVNGIVLGDIPSVILGRVMDHAWGKPPERHEHTGKDGGPVVTEVRRVIIHAREDAFEHLEATPARSKEKTH